MANQILPMLIEKFTANSEEPLEQGIIRVTNHRMDREGDNHQTQNKVAEPKQIVR